MKNPSLLDDLGVSGRELVLDRKRKEGVCVSLLQAGQKVIQQPVQRLRLQRRGGLRRLGARGGGDGGGWDFRRLRQLPGFEPGWQFNSITNWPEWQIAKAKCMNELCAQEH